MSILGLSDLVFMIIVGLVTAYFANRLRKMASDTAGWVFSWSLFGACVLLVTTRRILLFLAFVFDAWWFSRYMPWIDRWVLPNIFSIGWFLSTFFLWRLFSEQMNRREK